MDYFNVMWLDRPNKELASVGSVTGIQSGWIEIKMNLFILKPNVKKYGSSNYAITQSSFLCWDQYILHKLTISSYYYLLG